MLNKRSLLYILMLMVMVLGACGPAATEAPVATEAATEEATEAPEATEAATATEAPAEEPAVTELNILWAQWDPADYLQQIANTYEQETGVKVNIIQEPWGSFGDRFFTEMAAGGDAWDMVVGDSQWLGQGATQGHYLDITDFLVGEGIDKTVTPATLASYAEYPPGSGTYYAYPTEGDADGWAYRKDLFEDPKEKSAFKAKRCGVA